MSKKGIIGTCFFTVLQFRKKIGLNKFRKEREWVKEGIEEVDRAREKISRNESWNSSQSDIMQGNMNIYQVLTMFAKQRTNEHNASHYLRISQSPNHWQIRYASFFFNIGFVAKISDLRWHEKSWRIENLQDMRHRSGVGRNVWDTRKEEIMG